MREDAKKKKKHWFTQLRPYLLLGLLGGYLVFVVATGNCPPCFIPGQGSDRTASQLDPDFRLHTSGWSFETLDGHTLASSDLEGKVVVVNYWATWCGPCRRELPAFNRMATSSDELYFVGIALDQDRETLTRFLETQPLAYPVIHGDLRFQEVVGPIRSIPTTLVFGRDGKLQDHVVGAISESTLRRMIEKKS